jgi:transposase InsO family protein
MRDSQEQICESRRENSPHSHFCSEALTVSVDQFIEVVDSYIRWYNEKRIKISLGALSPVEYRESLGLTT